MNTKYIYKDAFAVIGKAGQGPAANAQAWITPLWEQAYADRAEMAGCIRTDKNGVPFWWGAMNDDGETNQRWGETGRYMAGCEADIGAAAPEGWTKWIIPAQTYLVAGCTMDRYGETFRIITNDPAIEIIGTIHERYPDAGNPNLVELYVPVAAGRADHFLHEKGQ